VTAGDLAGRPDGWRATSATGLLPLCHEAITTWQPAEGRSGPPSSLALKPVRGRAKSMITIILARAGLLAGARLPSRVPSRRGPARLGYDPWPE